MSDIDNNEILLKFIADQISRYEAHRNSVIASRNSALGKISQLEDKVEDNDNTVAQIEVILGELQRRRAEIKDRIAEIKESESEPEVSDDDLIKELEDAGVARTPNGVVYAMTHVGPNEDVWWIQAENGVKWSTRRIMTHGAVPLYPKEEK